MRTNIVIDEALIERARQLTGLRTKHDVIHEALRTLIQLREQAEARRLRGEVRWEGSLDDQRSSRSFDEVDKEQPR